MIPVLWGVAGFFLSAAGVAAYLPLARRWSQLDAPNHRSSHQRATPNSGGIAVVAAALVTLAPLLAGSGLQAWPGRGEVAWLFAATITLCVLGAWDDRRSLPASLRLAVTLVVSGVAVFVLLQPAATIAWMLAFILAVALAWLVNLYNFMDGLDGFAATQCVLTAGGIGLLSASSGAESTYTAVALVTAGTYLAFLLFNWPPAKLFMGDAGSLSAGLLLGWLGLWGWREGWLAPAAWLLLMSPFLVDATWTLAARAIRGAPLAEGHREHAYQRIARRWGSHRRVSGSLLLLHLLFLQPLAALASFYRESSMTFLALGLFPQLFLMVSIRRLK